MTFLNKTIVSTNDADGGLDYNCRLQNDKAWHLTLQAKGLADLGAENEILLQGMVFSVFYLRLRERPWIILPSKGTLGTLVGSTCAYQ